LHWDGAVLFQSRRTEAYESALAHLLADGWIYPCACSRRSIALANQQLGRGANQVYPGTCRGGLHGRAATRTLRVRTTAEVIAFDDRLQGRFAQSLEPAVGDFALRRRSGLFAYQLAVVVDDAWQRINDVVRGVDLLDSTPRQLWLQRLLGLPSPGYMHLPVVVGREGDKLSKQTGAKGVDLDRAPELAWQVLACLGLEPPPGLKGAAPGECWAWGVRHWAVQHLSGRRSIPAP
jgi:glutamyl-Q tRNA(Asp) synthetase